MSKNGIDHRHCKWPLGMTVLVKTPCGYLAGTVFKHDRAWRHCCTVDFKRQLVNMGDANGERYCHNIPFRNLKPVGEVKRPTKPWYKTGGELCDEIYKRTRSGVEGVGRVDIRQRGTSVSSPPAN